MSWNKEGNPKSQGNIDIIELHISYVALSLISRLLRIPELWLNSTDTWNICVEKSCREFLGLCRYQLTGYHPLPWANT